MNASQDDHRELTALRSIFQETSPHVGEEFLKALVKGLGQLLKADTTFVARALDDPPTRVRGITAWKDGAYKDSWEYDLAGNPCQLTYNGEPTFIPCDLPDQFPKKKDSGYESYLGIPLLSEGGDVIGHIAIYSSRIHEAGDFALDLAQLCGFRAEAEVRRLIAEDAVQRELDSLRESDQRKTEAVQVVSHELRTPLASVIGFLSLLDSDTLPSPVNTYIDSAKTGAQRLLHFINQQLDLETIVAGTSTRRAEPLNLVKLAEDARERMMPVAAPWQVELACRVSTPAIEIMADPGHMQRLFDNLLSNAIKFSPEGGNVTITTETTDDRAAIEVADQGPGIPADLQDHIFDRFARATDGEARQRGGAGLGLNIAKAIAEDHGGAIGFTTSPEGTVFRVELPLLA